MQNNLEAALKYAEKGFSIIPIKPDIDPVKNKALKNPYIESWKEYQTKKATVAEIKEWWRRWPRAMIGLVTGKFSQILVIDCDSLEAYESFQKLLPDSLIAPIAKTPRGWHFYFIYPKDGNITTGAGIMPGVDFRGQGGYIIAPPSINDAGKIYEWIEGLSLDEVEPPEPPESLINLLKSFYIYKGNSERPQETTNDHKDHNMFEDGRRDNDLFHTANCLVKGGMPESEIFQVLENLIISWGEKPSRKWIETKIISALKRDEARERNISDEVREWVLTTSGHFLTTDCHKELQLTTRPAMKAANMALLRLCEGAPPVLEKYGQRRGCYRCVDRNIEFMDFENADIENSIDLFLPLGLHNKTKIFPKGIIVIAGVSGMGKTLFAFNSIAENMGRFPIFYFNSEMGPEALKQKLSNFPIPITDWVKNMKVIDQWDFYNIADKIQPDAFNVIDYLEPEGDKPFNIHGIISAIIRRLNKGTALITIQKKPDAKMGTGGIYSIKAATLALALDWGKIEIVKNRFREADPMPNAAKINFEVHQGYKFVKKGDWYK